MTQSLCNAFVTPSVLGNGAATASDNTAAPADPAFTVSIKDNYCTVDAATTAGSAMLSNFRPTYDATVVERLRKVGATLVGKTNLDEFGMGSFTANSFFGRTINPWSFRNCTRVEQFESVLADEAQLLSAGGSSGGAAAALAAGTCIGSDQRIDAWRVTTPSRLSQICHVAHD